MYYPIGYSCTIITVIGKPHTMGCGIKMRYQYALHHTDGKQY
jgi:hypothetical protein